MTDGMAELFVGDHPSTAKLTLFLDGTCILIASSVSAYSLWNLLLSLLADVSTN